MRLSPEVMMAFKAKATTTIIPKKHAIFRTAIHCSEMTSGLSADLSDAMGISSAASRRGDSKPALKSFFDKGCPKLSSFNNC